MEVWRWSWGGGASSIQSLYESTDPQLDQSEWHSIEGFRGYRDIEYIFLVLLHTILNKIHITELLWNTYILYEQNWTIQGCIILTYTCSSGLLLHWIQHNRSQLLSYSTGSIEYCVTNTYLEWSRSVPRSERASTHTSWCSVHANKKVKNAASSSSTAAMSVNGQTQFFSADRIR